MTGVVAAGRKPIACQWRKEDLFALSQLFHKWCQIKLGKSSSRAQSQSEGGKPRVSSKMHVIYQYHFSFMVSVLL
jgi:hypothetical protein